MGTRQDISEEKRAEAAAAILRQTRWHKPRRLKRAVRSIRRVDYPLEPSIETRSQLEERVVALEREVALLKARERVMHLVETGYWGAARAELQDIGPAPELEGLRRVLEPARVTIAGPASGKGLASTKRWLEANRAAFRGKWVALRDGQLVDSDVSHAALYDRLKSAGQPAGIIILPL